MLRIWTEVVTEFKSDTFSYENSSSLLTNSFDTVEQILYNLPDKKKENSHWVHKRVLKKLLHYRHAKSCSYEHL